MEAHIDSTIMYYEMLQKLQLLQEKPFYAININVDHHCT